MRNVRRVGRISACINIFNPPWSSVVISTTKPKTHEFPGIENSVRGVEADQGEVVMLGEGSETVEVHVADDAQRPGVLLGERQLLPRGADRSPVTTKLMSTSTASIDESSTFAVAERSAVLVPFSTAVGFIGPTCWCLSRASRLIAPSAPPQ